MSTEAPQVAERAMGTDSATMKIEMAQSRFRFYAPAVLSKGFQQERSHTFPFTLTNNHTHLPVSVPRCGSW